MGICPEPGIVLKPKDSKGFQVLFRRWVVERTFAWMGRCRRLSKDCERGAWRVPWVGRNWRHVVS